MPSSWKIYLHALKKNNCKKHSSISKIHTKCWTFGLTVSCTFLIHKIINQIIFLFSPYNSCTMLKFCHWSWSTESSFQLGNLYFTLKNIRLKKLPYFSINLSPLRITTKKKRKYWWFCKDCLNKWSYQKNTKISEIHHKISFPKRQ